MILTHVYQQGGFTSNKKLSSHPIREIYSRREPLGETNKNTQKINEHAAISSIALDSKHSIA